MRVASTFSPPPVSYMPLTITTGIRTSAGRTPDKIALQAGERTLTYTELVDRIDRCAQAVLAEMRPAAGDNAAILAPNCLEYIEIVCGASEAGVAVATLNPKLTAVETQAICDDCEARLLFVHESLADFARAIDFATVKRIIVIGGDYEEWIAKARPGPLPFVQEWDSFSIPYTSGTTGKPKGVLLPHRSRVMAFFGMASEYGCYGPDDRYLATAPLFHGAGFCFAIAAIFLGGFCEILPGFDPGIVVAKMGQGFTGTFMVPTHFHSIFALEKSYLDRFRKHQLNAIVSNASALPQATKEKIVAYWGEGLLYECYGSTEGGIVTNLRPVDQLRKEKCVGTPFTCQRVKLLDDAGNPVKPGEVGELFSQSPFLFNGYYNQPEETSAALKTGWFSAGDLAMADEEGFYYIVDRKKDMVVSGGVNIYPREVEEVLFAHPAIAEAAVIGEPDDHWGEVIVACVVLRPNHNVTADELIAFCRQSLAGYKAPKKMRFLGSLPRNAAGKILKRVLRDAA